MAAFNNLMDHAGYCLCLWYQMADLSKTNTKEKAERIIRKRFSKSQFSVKKWNRNLNPKNQIYHERRML